MKQKNLSILLLFVSLYVNAGEGMWLPQLVSEFNESGMKKLGMKISAEDIYSINKTSLKDAIIQFGGGCTGEIVSNEGLILTNHHCGFSQIQSHSTVEHDYLTDGFWAKSKTEELACPGLTATFVIRIEDVTKKVLEGIADTTSESGREKLIAANIKKTQTEATKDTRYTAVIKPYFYGNEYYMLVMEVFKDVRMVGAPPSSIGKFGGDTDNWMWPRHTGDFSVFRIYANDKNEPAEYSKENKPFKPRNFLPISLKGVKQGDFTLTYGFPGATFQYYTSHAIKQVTEVMNPNRIRIRGKLLSIWDGAMKDDARVRIAYASKYAKISNYHKKFQGENKGMRILKTLDAKVELEKKFEEWAVKENKKQYASLVKDFANTYEQYGKLQSETDLMTECISNIEIIKFASGYIDFLTMCKNEKVKDEDVAKEAEKMKKGAEGFYKNYDAQADKKVMSAFLKLYVEMSAIAKNVPELKNKNGFDELSELIFKKSLFASSSAYSAVFGSFSRKKAGKKIEKDPAFLLMNSLFKNYTSTTQKAFLVKQQELGRLYRLWLAGLREMQSDRKFWPDANSTLRVAYGTVEPYDPYDGAHYDYSSSLKGIMEKMDSLNPEFTVPQKLVELYKKKDFGPYAVNGDVPVAFIATNHTTGGNSGSPLMDSEGRLIGINFDTNWEGAMGNYHFSADRVRNISVDIRYVLFIIDKFAGAGYLLNEMKVVN